MNGLASVTRRFPSMALTSRLWDVWHFLRIADILKLQWLTFSTAATIPGQALRAFVTMMRLTTTVARRLPVAGKDYGIAFRITGGWLGAQLHSDGFPLRPMPSLWTRQRVRDFVHQCVEHLFSRILSRIVLRDFNSLRSELTDTEPALRLSPAERPVVQPVLLKFLLSNLLDFSHIHDDDWVLSGKWTGKSC
jgi:hypothetical protein